MASDPGARARVIEYLDFHGPVEDDQGHATARLREAIGYAGTDVAFSQLLSAMARSGQIRRKVTGRRTYSVALASESTSSEISAVSSVLLDGPVNRDALDYDRLAASLVRHLVASLVPYVGEPDKSIWARASVDELEARVRKLERLLNDKRGTG